MFFSFTLLFFYYLYDFIVFFIICMMIAGIARLCCDSRRYVRSQALTYLQRALLMHDLQTLSATEWESCFNKVRPHCDCFKLQNFENV